MQGEAEVLVLIVDAGGGHRAVANALVAASSSDGVLKLRVESLQDILEPTDPVRSLFGVSIEAAYNSLIRRNLTRVLVPLLRVMHVAIRVRYRALRGAIEKRLLARPPALVVSLAPHFNGVIRDALRRVAPKTPFLVHLTDYADFPPHFWMEKGLDRVIVGSRAAEAQANGLEIRRVSRVSGMVLHPRFYRLERAEARKATRAQLGIPEAAPALLVLFGGWGSPEIAPLCEALLKEREDWHIIAIAGKNPDLEGRLRIIAEQSQGRLHGVGFTDLVAEFMAASDLLLTKPGPGTIAEAFHLALPMVVVANGLTVPQERFNARFLVEEGLSSVVSAFRELPKEAARLFGDSGRALAAIRERISKLPPNRAVYEALEIFSEEVGSVGSSTESYS